MPNNPYQNIRFLSVEELAELWFPERPGRLPITSLVRELRLSILNLSGGRDWRTEGLVTDPPDDDDLPAATTRIDKQHVRELCSKQDWPLPRFWFPDEAPPVRQRGRPSDKKAIVQEFERRAGAGELKVNVTAEARALAEWSVLQDNTPIQYQTIQKYIAKPYSEIRSERD